jgi:two-component system, OmpR family, phosphate regulon sensor histidine kinase PhoR
MLRLRRRFAGVGQLYMQNTSVPEKIVANSQVNSDAQLPPESYARAWSRRWQHLWATQRVYWRVTLLMFLAVLVVIGILALYWSRGGGTALVIGWSVASAILTALFVAALQINARLVRRVTDVLNRLADGDYAARADLLAGGELNQLSNAVNRLAERTERQVARRKRERDRFETVLHSMSDGVIMLDRRGYVALMNPSAERLLRSPADKALHESFVQVVRDYRLADVWQQCAQRHAEQTATVELSAGFFLRISVTPFLRGASNGFLVLLQDLSHLYRLEAVRRDFVSNISHELRTPLASIKALVDTLRDGAMSDPPAAEHFLGRMEIEVDSMTQMVQELLELSRIESGQAPLRLFPSGLPYLIEPAVERLRPQATRAGVTLAVVLPEDLPQVMVDADRIRQVVINLVHNAIKFTPAGGYVTVTARVVHDGIVVSVADTGIGIPAEDLSRIFERFYKADRARSSGGTGLGLAIAKHTVQAHNGRLWVESTEGKGSTFSFTLPLVNLPITQS